MANVAKHGQFSRSNEVWHIFNVYYVVFLLVPFIYGLYFSEFSFFSLGYEYGVTEDSFYLSIFALLILTILYFLELREFPRNKMDAYKWIGLNILFVLVYMILLGFDSTLTSLSVAAVIEVVAVVISVMAALLTINSRSKKGNAKTFVTSIAMLVLAVYYAYYVVQSVAPDNVIAKVAFVTYSIALTLWKAYKIYGKNRTKTT